MKILNPLAKSCSEISSDAYKYCESIKKNKYEKEKLRSKKQHFLRMHRWSWPISFKNAETTGIKALRKKMTATPIPVGFSTSSGATFSLRVANFEDGKSKGSDKNLTLLIRKGGWPEHP